MTLPNQPPDVPLTWPSADFTRTPYRIFADPLTFELEQERVFCGPTWNYLGLACEVAQPGDYLTCYVGTTPVILSRGDGGELRAFVNRCAHRGGAVARTLRGNAASHTCIYHQWTYDSGGRLIGVPLERGINGQGGYPQNFRKDQHGLQQLRIAEYTGVVFGTFNDATPPLLDYLGDAIVARMDLTMGRPLKVLGYFRNTIRANWKLFAENTRDLYHAGLLHPFLPTFGLFDSGQRGGVELAREGVHALVSAWSDGASREAKPAGRLQLEDPSVASGFPERDGLVLSISSIYPSTLFTIVGNALSIRQVRPKDTARVETTYTLFAYADDSDDQLRARRNQLNMYGPAGLVAMEDSEALELIQQRIASGENSGTSFIEMGGREVGDQGHLITEGAVRGFWRGYCQMMGIPTANATANADSH